MSHEINFIPPEKNQKVRRFEFFDEWRHNLWRNKSDRNLPELYMEIMPNVIWLFTMYNKR